MKSILTLLLIPLTLGVFSGCASLDKNLTQGTHVETLPFLGQKKAVRYLFPNGLRLVVVEDHSSPTFAYQTWFDVGSRDEVPGYTGLAHLFEHMMFKQTKNTKEGEFDRILEEHGAEGLNAFTSRDYTAYIQELPIEHLELLMKYESDRMVNLIVNDQSFKTEREVVQNERRFRNENSAEGMLFQEIYPLSYKKSTYRWPVIGYEQDLKRMTAKDASSFYEKFYAPNKATIVIVGDIKPEKAYDLVNRYYGHLKPQNIASFKPTQELKQTAARKKTLKLNVQVDKLMLAYKVPSLRSPNYPAINVIQSVLGGGKSSRLQRALVDKGYANSISVYPMDGVESSLFLILVNLQTNQKIDRVESIVLDEIKNLLKNSISQKELKTAKNKVLFDFYENLNNNSEKAKLIGFYETTSGRFDTFQKQLKETELLSSEKILKVANEYFKPESVSILRGVKK